MKFQEHRDQIMFRFTIGAMNNAILRFWEPGAPSFKERLDSLTYAFCSGYKTSVSIERMLDSDNVLDLILTVEPFVTDSIWLGMMNHIRKNIVIDSAEMEAAVRRMRPLLHERDLLQAQQRHRLAAQQDLAEGLASLEAERGTWLKPLPRWPPPCLVPAVIPDPARQIQVARLQDVLDEILEMPRVEPRLLGRTPLALDEHVEGELPQPEGQGALVSGEKLSLAELGRRKLLQLVRTQVHDHLRVIDQAGLALQVGPGGASIFGGIAEQLLILGVTALLVLLAAAAVSGVVAPELGDRPPYRVVTADDAPGSVLGKEFGEWHLPESSQTPVSSASPAAIGGSGLGP